MLCETHQKTPGHSEPEHLYLLSYRTENKSEMVSSQLSMPNSFVCIVIITHMSPPSKHKPSARKNHWSCSCDQGLNETWQCSCRSSDSLSSPQPSSPAVVTSCRMEFCVISDTVISDVVKSRKREKGSGKRWEGIEKKIPSDNKYPVPCDIPRFAWLVKTAANLIKVCLGLAWPKCQALETTTLKTSLYSEFL